MKKIISTTLLLLIIAFSSYGQLLWQISGKGIKEDSYLFGTHHFISISFLDSISGLYPAFNRSKTVVSEIVMNASDVNEKLMRAATLPDSLTITKLLNDEERDLLDKELSETLKINLNSIDMLHPATIQVLYLLETFKKLAHFDDNTKSDSYFQLVADKKGIPVIGLESIDKQIELLFPNDDLRKQAEDLVEMVRHKDELFQELVELNNLYKKGDLDGLYILNQKFNTTKGISQENNYIMIDERNIDWARQLPELIRSGPCFIAVGALHLPGENGLIRLLERAGFKVKPVKK